MAGPVNPPQSPFTKGDGSEPGEVIRDEDLELVMEAIRMVVTSGKGYGEIVITFKRGELDQVEPRPQLKPSRGGKEG